MKTGGGRGSFSNYRGGTDQCHPTLYLGAAFVGDEIQPPLFFPFLAYVHQKAHVGGLV